MKEVNMMVTLPKSNYDQLIKCEEELAEIKRAVESDRENVVIMQAIQQRVYDVDRHETFYAWREIVKNATLDVTQLVNERNDFEKRFHDMEKKLFELQEKVIPFSLFTRRVKDL